MQKGIVVFDFANYLDNVLVWNYAMNGFKRGIEKAGMSSIPACIHVLNSLKFRLLPKNCPREWRVGQKILHVYAGLLVNARMIALFACRRLDQNGNGGVNANNNKSWPKSLIVSDYGRIWYYTRILLKIGHAPITNMISNIYCTVSVIPYWELMHQANPNIHHTPQ
jgi:hypothetical protein